MTKEIKLNGSTYNLEGMSDEEVTAWLKDKMISDAVMERLSEKYSPDEIATLGTDQIAGEIQSMGPVELKATTLSRPRKPAPMGLLGGIFETEETK